MKDKAIVTIVAIVCITVLEALALLKGIDGALFSLSLSVIGGLVGYKFKEVKENYSRRRR